MYRELRRLTEERIQREFLRGEGAAAVEGIVARCIGEVSSLGGGGRGRDGRVAAMATVLMHYLCAALLIPAQRRVAVGGVEADMVVPDARTLTADPGSSLVVCVLESADPAYVGRRISDAGRIQPDAGNVWAVSPRPADTGRRTFVVDPASEGGCSFAGLAGQMMGFLDGAGSSRFRIFRAA